MFHFFAVPRLLDFSLDVPRIVEVVKHEKPKCSFLQTIQMEGTFPFNCAVHSYHEENLTYYSRKTVNSFCSSWLEHGSYLHVLSDIFWLLWYSCSYSGIYDKDLLKILSFHVLVVLDEAYLEVKILWYESRMVKKHENLILLRTFSKLAG